MKSLDQLENPLEVLEALNRYQRLTTKQISRLLFEGRTSPEGKIPRGRDHALRDAYRKCVSEMRDMGLIEDQQFGRTKVWLPTEKGVRRLKRAWHEEDIDGVLRKRPSDKSEAFMPHYLAAHDALIAFESAGALADLEVADFKDEMGIQAEWKGLQPDGYIYLTDGLYEVCALIEVERTSKVKGLSKSAFVKKVPRYIELMHSGQFPTQPIVFTFAKSWTSAEHLRKETQAPEVGGRANFWFGTIDMLSNPATFFDQEFLVATAKPRTIRTKLSL